MSMVPFSKARQQRLLELFATWRRGRPADPAALAAEIDRACAYNELFREEEESHQTAAELRTELDRYRAALAKARGIGETLPRHVTEPMQSNAMAYRDPLRRLPPELCRQLALVDAADLLRLLEDLAGVFLEQHAPSPGARQRFDLRLVREVANACRGHGVTVGASARGHFAQVVATILPAVKDPRDLIRQALKGGETTENT